MDKEQRFLQSRWLNHLALWFPLAAFLVSGALLGMQALAERDRIIGQGLRQSTTLANSLANFLSESLGAADRSVAAVARKMTFDEAAGDEAEGRPAQDLDAILRDMVEDGPAGLDVGVMDASGNLLAATVLNARPPRFPPSLPLDAFKSAVKQGLTIWSAGNDADAGPRVIYLARPYLRRDGELKGAVYAAVPVETAAEFFRSLDLGINGVAGIAAADGRMIARIPHSPRIAYTGLTRSAVFRQYLLRGPRGAFVGPGTFEDVRRAIAYRSVLDGRLVIYAGLAVDDLLASWRKTFFLILSIVALLSLVILALSLLGVRGRRAGERLASESLRIERQAREDIERILASTSDAFYTLDENWRFTFVNPQAERFLQKRRAELLGRVPWEIFPGARESLPFQRHLEAKRRNVPVEFEYFQPRIGRIFEVRAYPHEKGLSVYFHDVTEQRRTRQQLQQAQKMDAIGQLTGGVAHDFNNLLTVITGNTDVLLEGIPPGNPKRDTVELIRMAARRGAELTSRLLAFARRQALEPETVDINALLTGVEPLLRHSLGAAIDMQMAHHRGLWEAQVDPSQLESALMNLTINARDAMAGSGKLTFETTNITITETVAVPERELQSGDYVVIAVSDTGCGMSEEVLKKAFDPFFTTKEVGKGTGLGLSMVYGFAKQSGGTVRIYSEAGQGTTVRIYLPRALREAAVRRDPSSALQDLPTGTERVLVVEDDELVRRFTKSVLVELGYDIAVASTGAEAIELVEHGFKPDLLFTDVVLPGGMSGGQLADTLRGGGTVDKVLYTSGYAESAILHQGRLDRGSLLLNKPFGKQELAVKVRAAFAQGPASGPKSA